jgi:hypothetical protein
MHDMKKAGSRRFQYSLTGLMVAMAIVAIVFRLAGIFDHGAVIGLLTIVWIFWMIYRLVDKQIEGGYRNNCSPYDTSGAVPPSDHPG